MNSEIPLNGYLGRYDGGKFLVWVRDYSLAYSLLYDMLRFRLGEDHWKVVDGLRLEPVIRHEIK